MALAEEIRSLMEEKELSLKHHPAPDEITLLCSGGLAPDDREALLDHLSQCSACTDLVAALMPRGRGSSRPQPMISETEIDEAWCDLQARLAAKSASAGRPQPIQQTTQLTSRSAWQPLLLRLAAGLVIGAVGFGLGWGIFSGGIFADPHLIDLTIGVQRSGQEDLNYTTVPSSSNRLMLMITLREEADFPRYRIGVWPAADADASPILLEDAESGGPRTTFSLGIPRSRLSSGEYLVKILGFRDDGVGPVEAGVTHWTLAFE